MNDFPEEPATSPDASATRRRWMYGSVAALAGVAGVGWAWWRRAPTATALPEAPTQAQALWALTLETPSSVKFQMATLKGRPILVNFWATWCPPCVEELPLLDGFYRENHAKGWQVVGIAIDQIEPVNRFLRSMPLQFPVVLGGVSGLELGKSLGNLSGSLPFSVVLGSDGSVLHRKMGRVTPEELKAWASLR
jgi:thiol-disulfide isomerase/thioredoxin